MSAATSLDLLHRMVHERETLQPAFARLWPHLMHRDAGALHDFADATLTLSRVNAGPPCIDALWRAALTVPPERLSDVSDAGRAAAGICRFAGAQPTLACLQALPVAIRMTAANPGALVAWWQGLQRLSQAAPTLVPDVAGRTETLLRTGDGFADFVAAGLKATAADPVRRAAFFALRDPLAQALLARQNGTEGFAETQRMLAAFVSALWGGEPRLNAGPLDAGPLQRRTIIASGMIVLPPSFAGIPAEQIRTLYRAAVAHAQAHLTIPSVRHPVGTLKPLQLVLIGLVEDARVEALAIRRFPGLRDLWSQFHDARPGGTPTAIGLLARLARALLDPCYADDDGFVAKGRELFAAATLEDPAISREIGGLLGNDLGQMRVQFNARTYLVDPPYRDDNMHLWQLPEAPDDTLGMTVDAARRNENPGNDQSDRDPAEGAPAPRARDAGTDDHAMLLAKYPEWDAVAGVERPDWTSLRDTVPALRDPAFAWQDEPILRARIARLVRRTVIGRNVRQPPAEDGEELDIDRAIQAAVARRIGQPPNGRVYRDRRPRGRDLATLIILDVSQSTAAIGPAGLSVLAAERLAVEALASALEERGDRYALRAFASAGRDDVRLTRLKDFDEPLSATVRARLAGLSSGLSTRLGAALRHAGAELGPLRTTRKIVLVLTDGEPSDIDVPSPAELVEDARRAVKHLRLKGIDVFGIIMDPCDAGSGPVIFGRHNAIAVRRLEELPARLAAVYFRLALR